MGLDNNNYFLHGCLVSTAGWEKNLLEYCKLHPDVTVIDRVEGIRMLHNRLTMLTPLYGEGILVQVGFRFWALGISAALPQDGMLLTNRRHPCQPSSLLSQGKSFGDR
jgi:hypothetical protein